MSQSPREFAGEIDENLPKLDLHGNFSHQVENVIDQFLYSNKIKKENIVEVIYGIGTGKIKSEALKFLESHPLVEKVIDKGGSCIVLLYVNI